MLQRVGHCSANILPSGMRRQARPSTTHLLAWMRARIPFCKRIFRRSALLSLAPAPDRGIDCVGVTAPETAFSNRSSSQ